MAVLVLVFVLVLPLNFTLVVDFEASDGILLVTGLCM